mgnify:CR=1 FL=1
MKIYVASSWRNSDHFSVVEALRREYHDVYDFTHLGGFHWHDIDSKWQEWSMEEFRTSLQTPLAQKGFDRDWEAMQWAEACVLVLPCGRSAHLEAGYFIGAGKPLIILLKEGEESELMYKMANHLCVSMAEVISILGKEKTCPYPGCPDPYKEQRGCALCYE